MTVELPEDKLGEMLREQAKLDGQVDVLAPEGAEVDKWDIIGNAELDTVEYDGDNYDHLIGHFKTETRIQEKVARATHWQPAEYKNHYCETWVSIWWDMDPESSPEVHIEVTSP